MTLPAQAQRLRQIADDSHHLVIETNAVCHAHAANRNTALRALHTEYGLDFHEIARLTGIPARTVEGVIHRSKNQGKK